MTAIAAAIAIAGLGATIGTSLRQKKNEKKNQKMLEQQLQMQQERQKLLDQYGRPLMGQGAENVERTQNYLRPLVSGDRHQMMQTMAPEINMMGAGQQGAVAAQRSMYPRGGQTASQAASLPLQFQGQVNNALMSVRPQAAGQLGTLGFNQQAQGLQAMGLGGGLTNSMLQYGLDARQLSMQQGQMLGQGVGGLGNLFMQYMMNNNRGGNNGPYTTPDNNYNPYMGSSQPLGGWQGFGNPSYEPGFEESAPSSATNPASSTPSNPYTYGGRT